MDHFKSGGDPKDVIIPYKLSALKAPFCDWIHSAYIWAQGKPALLNAAWQLPGISSLWQVHVRTELMLKAHVLASTNSLWTFKANDVPLLVSIPTEGIQLGEDEIQEADRVFGPDALGFEDILECHDEADEV